LYRKLRQKLLGRVIRCSRCQQPGGTLIKGDDEYYHKRCPKVLEGRGAQRRKAKELGIEIGKPKIYLPAEERRGGIIVPK